MSCLGCTERYVGCHAVCADYLSSKREKDARKEMIKASKSKYRDIYEYRKDCIMKATRRT